MTTINNRLNGIKVAVPESRQLDTMAALLERRGATVHRAPLVTIHDAPDPEPVLAWLRRFAASPPAMFVILTGEGLRRLLALAGRHGLDADFKGALRCTRTLCRGPKPGRALREIGLKTAIQASAPTTTGVIATLEEMDISNQRIAVQLYGEDPNRELMNYLEKRQAQADPVAPYIYADEAEESRVLDLIKALGAGEINAIAFTSQPQYRRLAQVARKHGLESKLARGLSGCCVAAVGPVVRQQLVEAGITVDIMPEQAFFMKPLVTAIMKYFAQNDQQ